MPIPVIDLFAGPGGLGEGFSSFTLPNRQRPFDIRLSVEKEPIPHSTLELRAFYRQFEPEQVPEEYYQYVRGLIKRQELFDAYPEASENARREAWCATLGKTPHAEVMLRLRQAVRLHCRRWVLIGGPPCQAYSLVGRSRMKNVEGFATDGRHTLYKEYLRIIAERSPAVFVMENVQGILSSQFEGQSIFERILRDLRAPRVATAPEGQTVDEELEYHIYSLNVAVPRPVTQNLFGEDENELDAREFLVRSESYGIPQARPRVFLLGVRSDVRWRPAPLVPTVGAPPTVHNAIGDLPRIRSCISKGNDSAQGWRDHIASICNQHWFRQEAMPQAVRERLCVLAAQMQAWPTPGSNWIEGAVNPQLERDWFHDPRLGGVLNHEARGHMPSDLWRYFYAAVFTEVQGRSPKLGDFPIFLRPNHQNVQEAIDDDNLFSDRFRVQKRDSPSTTIVSHISKDGHYYIHPDPLQCRSLTVREAARLQTFPDNYFFEGSRTAQYHQVGNAVPPFLARQIASIVFNLLR